MAPSRRTKQVAEFVAHGDIRPFEVFTDSCPFRKYDVYQPVLVQRFGESVPDWLVFFGLELGLERAEQFIPGDQEHPEVFVEVQIIRRMVYPVMGRGYQDMFQPSKFIDHLGMNQDAPYLRGRIHDHNIFRPETQEGKWNKIDEAIERLENGGSESNGQVHQ